MRSFTKMEDPPEARSVLENVLVLVIPLRADARWGITDLYHGTVECAK